MAAIDKYTWTTEILWREKKGWRGQSLSERGEEGQREPKRESRPLPGQAFIAFLGTLHEDGPHLLCTGSL